MKKQEIECVNCFKIICRQCGWEADDKAVLLIKQGNITACPECGWVPS